jgi:hypothetical protein
MEFKKDYSTFMTEFTKFSKKLDANYLEVKTNGFKDLGELLTILFHLS